MQTLIYEIKKTIQSAQELETAQEFQMNQAWRRGYIAGLNRSLELIELEIRKDSENTQLLAISS
jgi:hypothetical protein